MEREISNLANTKRLTQGLPGEVRDQLAALGANLRLARRRRRLSVASLAERVMVSPPTIRKLEQGDPTVSLGVFITALWALGLTDGLKTLAAPESDALGLHAELQRLASKRRPGTADDLDF